MLDDLLTGIEQQRRGLLHLLERTRWDFFFGGFAEAHLGGHLLWHLGVPDHPRYDATATRELGDALPRVYRAIDGAIGSLLERLPAETPVLVVSPYSMGPHHHLAAAMDPLLERAGWLGRSRRGVIVADDPRLRALALARRALHQVVPASLGRRSDGWRRGTAWSAP